MESELADFLNFCLGRRLAPLTCSAYERDIRACIGFLGRDAIGDLRVVPPPDLRRFLAEEAMCRPAVGSQARTFAALKCFIRFLVVASTFRRPADAAGVTARKRVTPHTLRHVFASELLRAGAPPPPDPGAARAQAPRLHAALHPHHRTRATRRRQAAALSSRSPQLISFINLYGIQIGYSD